MFRLKQTILVKLFHFSLSFFLNKDVCMYYRRSSSIQTTNLWPKRVFSWLLTFSFTPTFTPKRNSGMLTHTATPVSNEHTSLAAVLYLYSICISCRVDTEEWMATVEVLLTKSCEACQWMVQYLVGPEGREMTRSVLFGQLHMFLITYVIHTVPAHEKLLHL